MTVAANQVVLQGDPRSSNLLPDSFPTFVKALMNEWHVPGLSLGVIKVPEDGGDVVTEFHGFGEAGHGRKVDKDTLYGIASNSKLFTAAAVGKLVDDGHFSWTDKVTKLLPDFKLSDAYASEHSTLIDLLSHRTGMPRHEHSYQVGQTTKELVEWLRHLRPSAEFRETWQYNNQMFGTAAHLVAETSKQDFIAFMQSEIFDKLGMSSTTYQPHLDGPDTEAKLSSSFQTLENGTIIEIPYGFNYSYQDLQFNAGPGGIVTSAADLLKWVEFLIRQRRAGLVKQNPLARYAGLPSPSTIVQLSTPHMLMDRFPEDPYLGPSAYGLGLMMRSNQGIEMNWHGGDVPGFGSQVVWSAQAGVGIVALASASGSGNSVADIACFRAFDELVGNKPYDWPSYYRKKDKKAREKRKEAGRKAAAHDKAEHPPSLPVEAYLGVFADVGYGQVEVCSPKSPQSASPVCQKLLERISHAESASTIVPPLRPDPVLYISWPGYFNFSHIILRHYDGDVWKGAFVDILEGTKRNPGLKMVYEDADSVTVRFRLEEGEVRKMEVSGVWGAGSEVPEDDERVEVSFAKV
ncbi:hypothetical protein NBRC10512_000848 [Rhodotorula toruloides]|uniref:RHTO0S06e07492g1_1 n=1 Tax=Rhodotorula toruloides TaxID=5286 RepID=A0A061AWE1_RHOTO|nr:RHTO0S06e07492g1_1 [Rhodotorula toruloides]